MPVWNGTVHQRDTFSGSWGRRSAALADLVGLHWRTSSQSGITRPFKNLDRASRAFDPADVSCPQRPGPCWAPMTQGMPRLAREDGFLAVPRTGSARRPPRPAQLADYATAEWIVPHRRWACCEIEWACGLAGFTPHAVAEATDFSTQLALVAAGVGVALIPELGLAEDGPT